MFDSTSHGLRRVGPGPAHHAAETLKYSPPGAAQCSPAPDSLLKVNYAPAVTPSMRSNPINEACRRGIRPESQRVCVCIFVSSCAVSAIYVMLVLRACLLPQKGKVPAAASDCSPGTIFYVEIIG